MITREQAQVLAERIWGPRAVVAEYPGPYRYRVGLKFLQHEPDPIDFTFGMSGESWEAAFRAVRMEESMEVLEAVSVPA